jgi:hypothetical protein
MRITSFDGSGAELASTTSEVAEFLLGMTSGPHDGASAEGTHVGYRGWYGSGVEPAFWFGAGLGWGFGTIAPPSSCVTVMESRSP